MVTEHPFCSFITQETGLDNKNEVIQLQSVLFKNNTFRVSEIQENMNKIMHESVLPSRITKEIKDVFVVQNLI